MAPKTDDETGKRHIHSVIERAFQSANINLLIGSGASYPAIQLAGDIETEIDQLLKANQLEEADRKKCEFIRTVQSPTNQLIEGRSDKTHTTLNHYEQLLTTLTAILIRRKTQLLPTQATIFTTNYDLFIEKASENVKSARLNDGFNRVPRLNNRFEFSPQNLFETTFVSGNLYDYKVEIPAINLVKLHGSLSWRRDEEDIICSFDKTDDFPNTPPSKQDIKEYLEQFAVVLPQMGKFEETVMNRIYYDLLRIYSNQLDKKNCLLIVFGFSFADDHIREITERALKNPTLKVIIFSYSVPDAKKFERLFGKYNNVDIIAPEKNSKIDFKTFNSILESVVSPQKLSNEDTNVD